MLTIKTTGVEDYLDGSANIKALIIGGPGAGKTRTSSYWPKPIFLDCENGRGSLADRNMPYAEIKSSKDMLDALDYLKGLERTPKVQRQFQTVVVDTADSFQRIIKDEWVQQTKAAAFSGFDAWGYLDTKMQLLFTRLLNLDYNVVVLVHYKDKTYKDGDNTIRELTLQLQGAISDQIFNDFGLVGWLGTYWAAEEGERVQKRGLTFQPTPDKPFLKDRFNATPKWMAIDFSDNDYNQIFEAFFNRPEFEALGESAVVGEIPDAPVVSGPVNPPSDGGPLPPRGTAPAATPAPAPADPNVSLDKQTKEQLAEVARNLGITVRGNTLKAELISAIQHARAAQTSSPVAIEVPPTSPSGSSDDATTGTATASTASPAPSADTEASPAPDSASQPDPWAPPTDQAAKATVLDVLGGEVIAEEIADTPATPQPAPPSAPVVKPTTAPSGPSACADCGADLTADWQDPAKKNAMRLSFVKYRRYLCTTCNAQN